MNESEQVRAYLEEQVSLGRAMQRLNENKDFVELFVDGYFKKLSEDISKGYSLLDDVRKARAEKDLYSISHFFQFCDMLVEQGANAQAELDNDVGGNE